MRQGAIAVTLTMIALAGCAGPGGPGSTAGTAPEGFACPALGTQIGYPDGSTLIFRGPNPADPFICLADVVGQGQTQRRLGNEYLLPLPDEGNTRRYFAALWPLQPGRSTSFLHEVSTPDGQLLALNTSWAVVGQQTMNIAGLDRQVLVMRNEVATARPGYRATWTYFYDTEARTIVGGNVESQQGLTEARNWRATRIMVPAR